MITFPTHNLSSKLGYDNKTISLLNGVFLVLLSTVILTISAKVQIPFWPVPLTFQPLAVVMLSVMLGWKLGTAAVLAYLFEGAIGLPVFANSPERGIGLAYLFGPTGGYLLGFAIMAFFTGFMYEKFSKSLNFVSFTLLQVTSYFIVYCMGVSWLSYQIGFEKAFMLGCVPFLIGDGLKIILASSALFLIDKFKKN